MKYLPLALVAGITGVSGSAGSTGVTRPTISLTIPSMSNPKNITNTSNIPDPLKNKTNTPNPHPPTTAPQAVTPSPSGNYNLAHHWEYISQALFMWTACCLCCAIGYVCKPSLRPSNDVEMNSVTQVGFPVSGHATTANNVNQITLTTEQQASNALNPLSNLHPSHSLPLGSEILGAHPPDSRQYISV